MDTDELSRSRERTPAQTLTMLADAGASFVLLRPHSKIPLEANWTHVNRTLDQALDHIDAGGNVGVHGIVTLDFDCDIATLPELPTLRKWRRNAKDRLSFAVRCPEPLPSRKNPRMEVKATGTMSCWATVHPSGAPILTAGVEVMTMSAGDIWQLWTQRTGQAPVREVGIDRAFTTPSQVGEATEIVARILQSRQGSEFAALMAGQHNYRSHSEADASLVRMLAWWCRGDQAQMLAIWQSSQLWRPDRGADYIRRTLAHGLSGMRRENANV